MTIVEFRISTVDWSCRNLSSSYEEAVRSVDCLNKHIPWIELFVERRENNDEWKRVYP
jgi:hypothetical protein